MDSHTIITVAFNNAAAYCIILADLVSLWNHSNNQDDFTVTKLNWHKAPATLDCIAVVINAAMPWSWQVNAAVTTTVLTLSWSQHKTMSMAMHPTTCMYILRCIVTSLLQAFFDAVFDAVLTVSWQRQCIPINASTYFDIICHTTTITVEDMTAVMHLSVAES